MLLRSVSLRTRGGGYGRPPARPWQDDFEAHPIAVGIPSGWELGDGTISPTWEVTGTSPLEGMKSLKSAAAAAAGERSLLHATAGLQNGTVSALVRPVTGTGSNVQPSVLGRYTNADNYVHMRISAFSPASIVIFQEAAGVVSTLKERPFNVVLGTTYRAKLVMDGAVLWALLYNTSGTLMTFARATTTVTAEGRLGVRHVGASATVLYDAFEATIDLETPPLASRSIELNGSTQYGMLAHTPAFDIPSSLTMEADCYPDVNTGNRTIAARFETGKNAYVLRLEGGKLRMYVFVGGSFRSVVGATTIPAGAWVHLAGVYDGTNLTVYVNGVQDGQTAQAGSISSVTTPLYIGRSQGGEYWDGKLANVRLWAVDRSASLGAAITGAEGGLVCAYEDLNVGVGDTWLDASQNLRDMPLFGTPAWSSSVP